MPAFLFIPGQRVNLPGEGPGWGITTFVRHGGWKLSRADWLSEVAS